MGWVGVDSIHFRAVTKSSGFLSGRSNGVRVMASVMVLKVVIPRNEFEA